MFADNRATGLLYHDVVDDALAPSQSGFASPDANVYKLSVGQFEQHLRAFDSAVPPSARARATDATPPKSGIAPTLLHFDDGGVSASTSIASRLEAHGWRGHFYISTDQIAKPGFMNANQVKDLHGRGHVIGSHSCSHPVPITALTDSEMDREWRQSCSVLADIVGQPCNIGSVPGGFLSRRVIASAARSGIELLFTSEPTTSVYLSNGCAVFGRYMVKRDTSAEVAADIARGRLRPRLQQWVFWNGKKGLKQIGGKYWLLLRRYLLSR